MGLLASRQQKLVKPSHTNVDLIHMVIKPIHMVVGPANAVIDP